MYWEGKEEEELESKAAVGNARFLARSLHSDLGCVAEQELQRLPRGRLQERREQSINGDSSSNIFIAGENLAALQLLHATHAAQIKMIYIDPPYNTGREFTFRDNYRTRHKPHEHHDDGGARHARWLSMMYPRLCLARELLRDDGVIFISIDDNEQATLKLLCEEIFGSKNFIVQIVWKKRNSPPNDRVIGTQHEYVLVFAKDHTRVKLHRQARSAAQLARYKHHDDHPKGRWAADNLMANIKGGRYVSALHYAIENPTTGEQHYPAGQGNWRFNKEKMQRLLAADEIYFGKNNRGRPQLKRFLCDLQQGASWSSLWNNAPLNSQGSREMQQLFGDLAVFENPKPSGLIRSLIELGSDEGDMVLDFFAGAASTAAAALQSGRHFLLVQLPVAVPPGSAAARAGYHDIAALALARIRLELVQQGSDAGVRVFTLSSTHDNSVCQATS